MTIVTIDLSSLGIIVLGLFGANIIGGIAQAIAKDWYATYLRKHFNGKKKKQN